LGHDPLPVLPPSPDRFLVGVRDHPQRVLGDRSPGVPELFEGAVMELDVAGEALKAPADDGPA
jgi:hypothetical protein